MNSRHEDGFLQIESAKGHQRFSLPWPLPIPIYAEFLLRMKIFWARAPLLAPLGSNFCGARIFRAVLLVSFREFSTLSRSLDLGFRNFREPSVVGDRQPLCLHFVPMIC
jgi:hypothetical protein